MDPRLPAEALKAREADKRMVVEGHTCSPGSDRRAISLASPS